MRQTKIKYLECYEPLLTGSGKKATVSREEMMRRLLDGEDVNLAEMGVDEYILESGRVSGKTSHDDIAAVNDIVTGVGDVWITRSEDGDIRNTVFASILVTITNMGFSYSNKATTDFKVSYSPFEVTYNANGNKIQFFGINKDINRTKGKMAPSGKLQRVIVEEANEVDDPMYLDALLSTAVRFFDVGSKMVFRYNPPPLKQHWCFKYFAGRVKKGAKKIYATWEDLARENLLTPATVAEILSMKKNDPLMYRYWYLGEVVNFSGMIYPQFSRDKHLRTPVQFFAERDRISELIIGVDEGTINDSTCATALAVFQSGRALVMDCFEIDPLVTGQKAPTEASRELFSWLCNLLGYFPFLQHVPRKWIFECAEGGQQLKLQFVADFGENCTLVTQKSITGDIKRVRSMLAEGVLFFYSEPTKNTTEILMADIEAYVFDEKTGMPKKGQRDDTIDSLEYATKLYYNLPLQT